MTTRVLPPTEWWMLPDETQVPWERLDPSRTQIHVTERDGAITGCVVLMQAWHAEFLWVHPAFRGRTSVIRRLRDALVTAAESMKLPTVWMSAMSRTMTGILCGLGAERVPGEHYLLTMGDTCRQR